MISSGGMDSRVYFTVRHMVMFPTVSSWSIAESSVYNLIIQPTTQKVSHARPEVVALVCDIGRIIMGRPAGLGHREIFPAFNVDAKVGSRANSPESSSDACFGALCLRQCSLKANPRRMPSKTAEEIPTGVPCAFQCGASGSYDTAKRPHLERS